MNKGRGFTLIELMIVVAIIAILAAVALPNYTRYVLKSHRSVAITALLDLASREARYFTTNNIYTNSLVALGYPSDPMPVSDANSPYYNLSISAADATRFTIDATPAGNQVNDTCGTYRYTDLGIKTISSGTLSECWKQ